MGINIHYHLESNYQFICNELTLLQKFLRTFLALLVILCVVLGLESRALSINSTISCIHDLSLHPSLSTFLSALSIQPNATKMDLQFFMLQHQ